MTVLLINTAGAEGIVALADAAKVRAAEILPARGTSEGLMPAIRRLFPDGLREVTAVGVVNGPGSFTGVRVGLSAAKGLCDGLGVRMIAMSRLGLVAASAPNESRVIPLLDAGRGEFYCGVYAGGQRVSEELLREDEVRVLMASGEALTCEARVAERLGLRLVEEPGAAMMRAMALARMAAGEWSDAATVDANYLRRTDAELLVGAR